MTVLKWSFRNIAPEKGEQEVRHARVSVGQTPRATQRCRIWESARELSIRDTDRVEGHHHTFLTG